MHSPTRRLSPTRSAASASTVYDASRDFGSGGRLRSLAVMDWLGKYPDDPVAEVPRREQHAQRARPGSRPSLAGVPGFPRSHRTALGGAARPRPGALELLLRFRRLGDGGQRHRGSRRRLVPDRPPPSSATAASISTRWGWCRRVQVPSFFYVEARPTSSPNADRRTAPRVGVTFNGTRRDVLIQDVIAIDGPRVPSCERCAARSSSGVPAIW